ncbi:hypothetical protein [Rubrobacter xylanophilus]|nr:hypothetical protein [Rubrobacter xylanophilus]
MREKPGVAALPEAENLSLDAAGIKARILDAVDGRASFAGKVLTGGRLNAARAPGQDTRTVAAPQPDTERPTVSAVRPKRTRDRTPVIAATVRDDRTNLRKRHIRLYVDGRRKGRFSYDKRTDRLRYQNDRLSYGSHRVRVVARDASGNVGRRSWTARVVRR